MAGDHDRHDPHGGAPAAMSASPHELAADGPATLADAEARLRILHGLRVEARLHGDFEPRYVRFVRALRERLHPRGVRDLQTVEIEGGLRVTVDVGDRLGCDVFYGYYDEAFEARLFGAVIQPGATVIDVGANFGYYTLIGARAAGPTGMVYAFEPDAAARDLLQRNVEANGFGACVTILASAVGDADGEVAFHVAEEPAFSGLYDFGRSTVRDVVMLPIRSLDSLAAERGVTTVDAIKIDVEGHDAPVLRGARALLRRSPDPLIVLEVSTKNLDDTRRAALLEVLTELEADGFEGRVLDLNTDGGLRRVSAEVAVTLGSVSLLLTRNGSATAARLIATIAEQLALLTAPLEAQPTDGEPRPLALFAGLDPALVASALRDKQTLQERFAALHLEAAGLRDDRSVLGEQVERLKGERARLAQTVERLAAESADRLEAGRTARAQLAEHRALAERLWAELQEAQARAAEQQAHTERLAAEVQAAAGRIREGEQRQERLQARVKQLKAEVARLQRTPGGLLNRAAGKLARQLGAAQNRQQP